MKTVVVKKGTKMETIAKAVNLVDDGGTVIVFPGRYEEKLKINKSLKIYGLNPENTVITYSDYARKIHEDGLEYNTFRTYTLMLAADNIELRNLTIENASGPGEVYGQAVALHTLGDKIKISNCILKSYQDTLFLGPLPEDLRERYQSFLPKDELIEIDNARVWVDASTIIGDVDFIFGSANAIFTNCTIKSLRKGYVAAPSTPENQEFGITFLNCTFTGEGENNTYLARPWRAFGKAVFIDCEYDKHLLEEGFHNWEAGRENTCRFYEADCRYSDGRTYRRASFGKTLSDEEKANYTIEKILA
ncbi:MAG TPA: pectinesterase family protein [Bacilli bacterium]